jgi:hypothetical protein
MGIFLKIVEKSNDYELTVVKDSNNIVIRRVEVSLPDPQTGVVTKTSFEKHDDGTVTEIIERTDDYKLTIVKEDLSDIIISREEISLSGNVFHDFNYHQK